ncbi:MAG: hypothetical protein BHW64_04250 [Candidatus Melainabacteria bacterium LEY3_CP_29_8]|nr:MAG: hypothetical protein BHW64_04250 [Candidatus Melainabacteria bacterium LEY3_CP_29_8]
MQTINKNGISEITTSQFGEDIIVNYLIKLLKNNNIINDVTYIDIGACDPVRNNNTVRFYEQNLLNTHMTSKSILIEANPYQYERCKEIRPNDIVLNAVIVDQGFENKKIPFYVFANESGLNTMSKTQAESILKELPEVFTHYDTVMVETITINEIIEKYFKDKPPVFIDLDIEGIELKILKSFNFKKCKPLIWCIETSELITEYQVGKKENDIVKFMKSKGYEVYADTYLNTIFVESKTLKTITRKVCMRKNVIDLEKIFSVKNSYSEHKSHKVINLLGMKIKIKRQIHCDKRICNNFPGGGG